MSIVCWRSDFFFSSRRRHTRSKRYWSSDVCSSDLGENLRRPLFYRFLSPTAPVLLCCTIPVSTPGRVHSRRVLRPAHVQLLPRRERSRGRTALQIGRASCRESVQMPAAEVWAEEIE